MADSGEKPPQFLPQHTYDGIIYDFIFPASVLDEIKKFEYRPTDVICAGYPKTGECALFLNLVEFIEFKCRLPRGLIIFY